MIPWLRANDRFPPIERALAEPNGLLAAGADLDMPRLLDAYRHGIFPWYSEGQPVLWWSPDPRMVLFPRELRLSRSLRRRIARSDYVVKADSEFEAVMRSCAAVLRPGQEGTWITQDMIRAYSALHRAASNTDPVLGRLTSQASERSRCMEAESIWRIPAQSAVRTAPRGRNSIR